MRGIPTGHTKQQKEMVRKRAKSGMRKAQETGELCNTFIAYLIWNPTYRELQGVGHLPEGMEIPDVNAFLQEACRRGGERTEHRRRPKARRRGQRLAGKSRDEIVVDTSESDESPLGGAVLEQPAARPPMPGASPPTHISGVRAQDAEATASGASGTPDPKAAHQFWLDVMDDTPATVLPADAALVRGPEKDVVGPGVDMTKPSAAEQAISVASDMDASVDGTSGKDHAAGTAGRTFGKSGELLLREPAYRASGKELMRRRMWKLMVEFRQALGA